MHFNFGGREWILTLDLEIYFTMFMFYKGWNNFQKDLN